MPKAGSALARCIEQCLFTNSYHVCKSRARVRINNHPPQPTSLLHPHLNHSTSAIWRFDFRLLVTVIVLVDRVLLIFTTALSVYPKKSFLRWRVKTKIDWNVDLLVPQGTKTARVVGPGRSRRELREERFCYFGHHRCNEPQKPGGLFAKGRYIFE